MERDIDEVKMNAYKLQERADRQDCRKADDLKEDLTAWKEESGKLIEKARSHMENHFETNISGAMERVTKKVREDLEKTWTSNIKPLVVKEIKGMKAAKALEGDISKEDVALIIEQKMDAVLANVKEDLTTLKANEETRQQLLESRLTSAQNSIENRTSGYVSLIKAEQVSASRAIMESKETALKMAQEMTEVTTQLRETTAKTLKRTQEEHAAWRQMEELKNKTVREDLIKSSNISKERMAQEISSRTVSSWSKRKSS